MKELTAAAILLAFAILVGCFAPSGPVAGIGPLASGTALTRPMLNDIIDNITQMQLFWFSGNASTLKAYVDYNQTNRVVLNGSASYRNASSQNPLSPWFNLSTTFTTVTFIRGASGFSSGNINATIPSAGTYFIHLDMPTNNSGCNIISGAPAFVCVQLNDGGVVAGSTRCGLQYGNRATGGSGNPDKNASVFGEDLEGQWFYTATGAVAVNVQARYFGTCTGGWIVIADTWRQPYIQWWRVV